MWPWLFFLPSLFPLQLSLSLFCGLQSVRSVSAEAHGAHGRKFFEVFARKDVWVTLFLDFKGER